MSISQADMISCIGNLTSQACMITFVLLTPRVYIVDFLMHGLKIDFAIGFSLRCQ